MNRDRANYFTSLVSSAILSHIVVMLLVMGMLVTAAKHWKMASIQQQLQMND